MAGFRFGEDLIATFGVEVEWFLTTPGGEEVFPSRAINQQSCSYKPARPEIDSTISYTKC